jgi:transcriptional regulator with XRE-family HTH domain
MLNKNISRDGRRLLAEYMKKNNLERKDLGEKFKVSQAFLSYYFSGKRSLGKALALEISKETGIPLESLIV